ncbi:hypothetical protein [Streptomyces chrestomyceticus]|uniref:hypothetical protein n=1 Tax=Streptomyces chrestomyceticus TaxID=68185 RepID=UPI0035A8FF60
MSVQRPLQGRRHQGHEFLAVVDRPESEALPGGGERLGFRAPLQAQPFDEEPGTGPFQYGHAVFDGLPGRRGLTPVRRDEAAVLNRTAVSGTWPLRERGGHRGTQQPHSDVHGVVAFRGTVFDVDDVQELRCVVGRPAPPGHSGQQALTAQGDPHPFRASAAGGEVVRQFVVEDVRQTAEEVEFVAPGDRAHGQVVRRHGRGTLR